MKKILVTNDDGVRSEGIRALANALRRARVGLGGRTRVAASFLFVGQSGVGKTQLAKSLAELLGRTLVRLQCYEGLDEAKALYEWNYRKQLLRIQAEAEGAGWQEVQDDIFGEEFLLERPLMTAIASTKRTAVIVFGTFHAEVVCVVVLIQLKVIRKLFLEANHKSLSNSG